MNDARDSAPHERQDGMPPLQVRASRLLLFVLAVAGLITVLARSDGLSSYALGELMAPWLFVWGCALLALSFDGSARHRTRAATCVLLGFVTLASVNGALGAGGPGEFLDAAVRIVLGGSALVLLCLPEASGWFRRL
ncbi:hypothetical protein [Streptomyces phaeofaciens]|uniref:hypothetical protein n=1 Tax=Streptomyces phaeofaciens TaxID=68254 RepID=UPI0036A5F4EA